MEHKAIHECNNVNIRLSDHGILCTSLIAGKSENADFFGICKGDIRGVAPACDIHTYSIGCPNCSNSSSKFICYAFERAKADKVDVISMSMGYKVEDLRPKTIASDIIGRAILGAFKQGIIVCVSAGNKGPNLRSIGWGMPWCLNVGACTSGKIGITDIEVGVKTTNGSDPFVYEEKDFKIIGKIEVSYIYLTLII